MPRKKIKKTKKKQTGSNIETKKYIFAVIFILLSFMAATLDRSSDFGYYYSELLLTLFGQYFLYIFSPILIALSISLFKEKNADFDFLKFIGLLFYFTSIVSIIGFFKTDYTSLFNIFSLFEGLFGFSTSIILFIILFFISLYMLFNFSLLAYFFTKTKEVTENISIGGMFPNNNDNNEDDYEDETPKSKIRKLKKKEDDFSKKKEELEKMMEELDRKKEAIEKQKQNPQMNLSDAPKKIAIKKVDKKLKSNNILGGFFEKSAEEKQIKEPDYSSWQFPELDLLDERSTGIQYDENDILHKELEIQQKLLQFKIEVEMQGYKVGPTVTQFRLKPKDGVKLQKIENLKKDLTLALHAKSIRIQAPIPGQGVVGIEVPNENRAILGLKELIDSKAFNSKKLELPIALGKDVSGDIVVGDLARMPHLLVAGQTASGKSIGMNGFLISLLYKFSPSELKIIMVDPKMVELSVYNGIPHLLTPVITKPEKATNALKWAVAEMLRRYDLAKGVNARNLLEYNKKVDKKDKLPYIVIVIDELADLMMSGDKKEVEGSIARIAQMARAVGMHLIVATQRPSVDVITGLIKANIPSRIAFTVASQIDSRTVIDKSGAEDLLGRGDMLYYPTGAMGPERVQGALIETHEVESVVNQLKMTVDPDMINNLYDDSIVNGRSKIEGSILENYKGDQEEDPEIIEKAMQVVKEAKKGSTSLVQRKLGLGYARAAKVLDILEELGVVGPANGSKPREVYID